MSDAFDSEQPAGDPSPMQRSGVFDAGVIEDIQIKAELARYRIRGFGILRQRTWATFDDLTFVPGTLTRIPLEGYREKCRSKTVLGTRFAAKPLELDIPLMVTGMSYGALSRNAKAALARGARMVGTSTTTGDGGMLELERTESKTLIYEVLPSRYGIDIHHLRQADAIELTIGQGAKPGTGGLLLGSKVSEEIAKIRDLPPGVDQRSPCRHPDFLGPDDMVIKIEELREATDWQVPI
ncbi:MAG TPA: glutamate synthase-related protein, partial [Isosphaeraceae bacterium]|nr:glutamate synthase-related protein [Isosphaeraceae bacterium]